MLKKPKIEKMSYFGHKKRYFGNKKRYFNKFQGF